jgi:hypothetical protein
LPLQLAGVCGAQDVSLQRLPPLQHLLQKVKRKMSVYPLAL